MTPPTKKKVVKKKVTKKKAVKKTRGRRSKTDSTPDEYGLLPMERKLADLYRAGPDRGNGARCYLAIRPKVKDSTAKVEASKILNKPNVLAYIALKDKESFDAADISAERILREMARIAFFDPRKLYNEDGGFKDPSEWDDDTAAVIASLEVVQEFSGKGEDRELDGLLKKVKLWDKGKHLEMLAKHHKLLTDKFELGEGTLVVIKDLSGKCSSSDD
jgi:phage terminase small subunit